MIILYVFNNHINTIETTAEIDSQVSTTEALNISFENRNLTTRTEIKVAKTDISTSNTNTILVLTYLCAYVFRSRYIFSIYSSKLKLNNAKPYFKVNGCFKTSLHQSIPDAQDTT